VSAGATDSRAPEQLAGAFLDALASPDPASLARFGTSHPELAAAVARVASEARALLEGRSCDLATLGERFPEQHAWIDRVFARLSSVLDEERTAARELAASLPAGTRLGAFEIVRLHRLGGMAAVYRARGTDGFGPTVALKVLHDHLALDPAFRARLRREAEQAASIRDPGLAEVYGAGEDGGHLYYAMRFVEGVALEEVLSWACRQAHEDPGARDEPGRVEDCVRLVRAIADALASVHAHALVHRDVKPGNVILEGAGADVRAALRCRPILVDFGLARPVASHELTTHRTFLGTPSYMSPEAILGRPTDARSDVFMLGVVLYDLLALVHPRDRPRAAAKLPDLETVDPKLPQDLASIVAKRLELDPGHRYFDAAALREDLDHFLEHRPVRARPRNPLARFRLDFRRRRTRAGARRLRDGRVRPGRRRRGVPRRRRTARRLCSRCPGAGA
jgi:serine/threonine-protein kinase